MQNKRFRFFIFFALMAAVLLCVNACAGMLNTTGGVQINEVVSSNSRSLIDDIVGSPDWIELYNSSSSRINLKGYFLSDNLKDPKKWEFPDVSIAPKEYLVVYAASYNGDLPDSVFCTGFGLSKSGERLYLFDQYINILDDVNIPALKTDVSYARDDRGVFGFCAHPTAGAANTQAIVETLEEVSFLSGESVLILSEVMPQNESGHIAPDGRRYEWAELYNPSNTDVPLIGYFLSDDHTNSAKWQLPDATLQAGERLIVYFGGGNGREDEFYAPFGLDESDDSLFLSTAQGDIVGEITWEVPILANVAVIASDTGGAYTAYATPGEENDTRTFTGMTLTAMDAADPVVISEVLPRNRYSASDSDGERNEWAEIHNRGSEAVSLAGYYLSDDADNPAKWAFPDVSIAPDEYLLIFLSGKDRTDGGELHASFRLSTSDTALTLTNLSSLRIDILPLDPALPDNVSTGRDTDGGVCYYYSPTPRAANDTVSFSELAALPNRNPDGVFFSEVSAAHIAKSGDRDWIELYNPTSKEISLAGWRLSDDIDTPDKYVIQNTRIGAGAHALLYASGRSSRQTEGTLPFGISPSGETLFLFDENGVLRDYFATGAQRVAVSSGRDVNDPAVPRLFYTTATPGAMNGASVYRGYTAAPIFSNNALYLTGDIQLTLRSPSADARIYYTLDGSAPTTASMRYEQPIHIHKNTPVRAIAISDGLLASEVVSHTYLFEKPHTLPVVCLSGAPNDISTVYAATEKAQRKEREGHFAYYETDGRLGIAIPCGLRVSGASTLTARQKSFSVFFRGGYGQSAVQYPFFAGYHINTFSSLVLRTSGQDRTKTRMRDSLISRAAEGLYIDNVATKPVIVYINGVYYGIYDLNENQNEDFLAAHYGADPDAVDIVRRNVSTLAGTNVDFKRVRSFGLNRSLGTQSVYEEYCQWVDMDYVIDYLITQTFFANGDMFNQKYWRSHDYAVKWRPLLFDMDLSFSTDNPTRNILPSYFVREGIQTPDLSFTNMDIYCGLKANAGWCDRFAQRYVYVVYNHYNAERLTALVDEYAAMLRPEMTRHLQHWGTPSSADAWERNVKALRDCLAARPEHALKALKSFLNLSDAQMDAYKTYAIENAAPLEFVT